MDPELPAMLRLISCVRSTIAVMLFLFKCLSVSNEMGFDVCVQRDLFLRAALYSYDVLSFYLGFSLNLTPLKI